MAVAGERHIHTVREPVKDEYIVLLVEGDRHDVPALANALANEHNGKLIRVWNSGIQAFWVSMTEAHANAMLHNPHVAAVEENAILHESTAQDVGGTDPFWHLDRVNQRFGTDGSFQYCNGAADVYAYIFDRGVRAADPQLSGRVQAGKNAAPADGVCDSLSTGCSGHTGVNDPPPYPSAEVFDSQNPFSERNPCGEHNMVNAGHGTAVATILGGTSVGVARTTKIIPIRIANCNGEVFPAFSDEFLAGTMGSLFEAFNWFFNENTLWDPTRPTGDPNRGKSKVRAVANFSVYFNAGVDANHTEYGAETYIKQMIHGGVVVVASANNQGKGDPATCTGVCSGPLWQVPTRLSYSNPQPNLFTSSERLISVGGTTMNGTADKRWVCVAGSVKCSANDPGSNFGAGVDIWAPADNVQSGGLAFLFPGTGDTWPLDQRQYRRPFSIIALAADGTTGPVYTRSGTSFSAPMVAGAAARLLSEDSSLFDTSDPSSTPLTVWNRLKDSATHLDATAADLGAGSPNLFLYIGGVNFKTQPQSVTMTGSTATLSAEAVGTALTYQLYEGQSGNVSVPVGSVQSSGTFTISPSSTKTYWIRATNTCPADNSTVTGDSAEATVTVAAQSLVKPNTFSATMLSTTTVHLSWAAVPGAQHYEIWRREHAGALHKIAESTSAAYTDTPVASNTAYVYQVCASPGSTTACTSSFSDQDLATTVAFTSLSQDPVIRLAHFNELLAAVNVVRAANPGGGTAVTWSQILQGTPPPPPPAANGLVFGEHILALRRTLDAALSALLGTTPSAYIDPNLPGSPRVAIKAIHLTEIRSRMQ